jgi:phosphatidylinositol glycan class B
MEGRPEERGPAGEQRLARPIVAVVLLLAAIPRVWAALWDQGMLWPDEIYQSVEQAHRWAFGYGFIPWEFQDGARSWLFPGALGLLWKIGRLVGVTSEPALLLLARATMVGLALLGIYASMRIAEALAGPTAALLAGLFGATFPGSLIYGHRCMTEMASGPILAVAVWLSLGSDRRRLLVAGLLAAAAVFLRYQNGLVAAGLLALLLVSRRRDAVPFAVGAIVGGLAGGALDWLTWGRPFHSLLAYLHYNVVQGKSATYGVAPFSYYAETAWSSTGIALLPIALGTFASWRRAPGLLVVLATFVLAHSLIGHKELRFLMPIVPLLLALAAAGLADLDERLLARERVPSSKKRDLPRGRRAKEKRQAGAPAAGGAAGALRRMGLRPPALAVGIFASLLALERASSATLSGVGQPVDREEGAESVWHRLEGVNLSLRRAGQESDLCGVLVAGVSSLVWTGGYTYLHRDVPILATNVDAAQLVPFANYVIMPSRFPPPPGFAPVDDVRDWTLLRRQGGCQPVPQFTRLFQKE